MDSVATQNRNIYFPGDGNQVPTDTVATRLVRGRVKEESDRKQLKRQDTLLSHVKRDVLSSNWSQAKSCDLSRGKWSSERRVRSASRGPCVKRRRRRRTARNGRTCVWQRAADYAAKRAALSQSVSQSATTHRSSSSSSSHPTELPRYSVWFIGVTL